MLPLVNRLAILFVEVPRINERANGVMDNLFDSFVLISIFPFLF